MTAYVMYWFELCALMYKVQLTQRLSGTIVSVHLMVITLIAAHFADGTQALLSLLDKAKHVLLETTCVYLVSLCRLSYY